MDLNNVYGAFIDYYGNIELQKVKEENGYIIYAAEFATSLMVNRYLFVICEQQFNNPVRVKLNDIDWICIQTRESEDYFHNLPKINHVLSLEKSQLLKDACRMIEKEANKAIYNCVLPLKITLIKPKKQSFVFPDEILLFQVLETYNCSIELL